MGPKANGVSLGSCVFFAQWYTAVVEERFRIR
jgi:hypothetical protein